MQQHAGSLTDPLALEHLDIRLCHLWVLGAQGGHDTTLEIGQEATAPFTESAGVVGL